LQELYEKLKREIMELGDDIKIVPRKLYVAFKRNINFVDVEFQKKQIKLYLNIKKGKLEDPRKITRDISSTGHWGNGDYLVLVSENQDLTYVMTLIKQAYDRNK
jgi:predicted transport protein